MTTRIKWGVAAVTLLAAAIALAEPVSRAALYDSDAQTSNDPRRVPVPKGYGEPKGTIVVRNARLFDGTGATARSAAILIEGNHIRRIEATEAALAAPADAQVVDAGGRTVMPGLIDLHTHLTYRGAQGEPEDAPGRNQAGAALRGQEKLRYFVESGITSVRDTGSDGVGVFMLKRFSAEGRIPGPRVFAAGSLITGIGGHGGEGNPDTAPSNPDGTIYEATGADGFRAAVRIQFKKGADFIKLASHFSAEEVRAAVDEAHNLGVKVTVDSESIYTQMAVDAGVDCVEHPLPRSDQTVKQMAARGIPSVITLVPYQIINKLAGGYFFSTSRRFTETDTANFAMARKLKAAGVTLGIGTDLVADWYTYLPDAYVQELRNFLALGYTPTQALVTATKTNAEILGMADRLGTLAVGRLADLIIVEGRPDEDVEALKNVDTVIVNGRVVVRGRLLALPHHEQAKPPYGPPAT